MGNDGLSKVIGFGDVCLKTSTWTDLVLEDVRHALGVRLNLISSGKLDDEGFQNNFGMGQWKLAKEILLWLEVKSVLTLSENINAVSETNTFEVW